METRQLGVCLKPFIVNCGDGQKTCAHVHNFRMTEMYEEKTWQQTYMGFYKSDKKTAYACFLFCVYTDLYT